MLIDKFYECLAKKPKYNDGKSAQDKAYMYFIEGYLIQHKNSCWWKNSEYIPLPDGPAFEGLQRHILN